MQIPYGLVRPVLFKLDAERAHRLTLRLLTAMPPSRIADDPPSLRTTVAGLRFSNPVGIAAGFDKNAEVLNPLLRLGFGFVEAGTVTPLPQPGNPKPRMFRLTEDQAVINRLGFNNNGLEQALDKFKERAWHRGPRGVTGLNVGANKDSRDRIADYALSVEHAAPFVDYITVNISSPNTPGLRTLQSKDELAELLARVMDARGHRKTPIFLKVAPDVTDADIGDIAVSVVAAGVDGLVVSNTTIERPETLKSAHAPETGGLSGRPLMARSTDVLRAFRQATVGAVPLIGVGGIASADDAYAKIRAGASLVQLYTALVYQGPSLVGAIKTGLAAHLRADGFERVSQAVGADA
ncbi:quinone-dependent dihydroorotate dehydrogenase [Sphingosinicella sp.]|jgi:dihydroorotate dehydrogenase|uniref:quinone-dependent dihydroorotate dehydrogenase n=1 Tax=Sphingosinicella sp. TaxID=1917971 RepID=UPI00185D41D1|nr:quinone-dependent dihydroorotate dehydrogenase [Sphingosinicella sp.]MBA4759757.1 quinone-dependent dihydroorotate dehydrogenase [Sphingosinicella sp.]MEA3539813.1 quinone-dependent dihydroorotate dehydrogenase [Pseudomonadota bacterium]